MAERPVNSEGDLTDKAFEMLNSTVDAHQDNTVNDLISAREAAMLSLVDRLGQLPPVGTRRLYQQFGEGDDRIAIQTIPYVLSKGGDILSLKKVEEMALFYDTYSDKYHLFAHLVIAKEGFFSLPTGSYEGIDFSEFQNPFVVRYRNKHTGEVATKIISTHTGVGTSIYRNDKGGLIIETIKEDKTEKDTDTAIPISIEIGMAAFNQVDMMVRKYIKEKEAEERRMIDLAYNLDKEKNEDNGEDVTPTKKRRFLGRFRGN